MKEFQCIPSPELNTIYSNLPDASKSRLSTEVELVYLELNVVLCEPNRTSEYAYFPIDAIVALSPVIGSEIKGKVSLIGHEGLVGILKLLGDENISTQICVMSGFAYRLEKQSMQQEFYKDYDTQKLCFNYLLTLVTQLSIKALCNRQHSIEQQFCRLLLQIMDRKLCENFTLTQNLAARLLGVRRESISQISSKLHNFGIISYHRGQVTIHNC